LPDLYKSLMVLSRKAFLILKTEQKGSFDFSVFSIFIYALFATREAKGSKYFCENSTFILTC